MPLEQETPERTIAKRRLLSAKGGLMMGTKKVGTLPSRPKRAVFIIAHPKKDK